MLIKYPPAYLLFSIDGATKETYEKIRINGNFDVLVNNMKELASLYRKNHVLCVWGVNFSIMDENIDEIPLFYKKFHSYFKLHNIHFNLLVSLSGDRGDFFNKNKLSALSKWVPPCKFPFDTLVLLHDQRVSVCCRDYHGDLVVGDLKRESLDKIWDGPKINILRKAHLNAKDLPHLLPKACQECYAPSKKFSQEFDVYAHFVLQKYINRHGVNNLPILEISRKIQNFITSSIN